MLRHARRATPAQLLKLIGRKRLTGLVAVCLSVLLPLLSFGLWSALAEDWPNQEAAATYTVNSSDDLIAYARAYAAGYRNPDDTLQLALSGGSYFVLPSGEDGFVPIGLQNRPFNGKVEIADNAINRFVCDAPLFGGITTDARIVNASGVTRELVISRISDAQDAPLFASFVLKGETVNDASWDVRLAADDRDPVNRTAYPFAGVIGSIADECVVDLSFVHDSVSAAGTAADAESAGDLGLICGTLGAGAELTFDVTAAADFNVVSTGGHAGGVVGVMEDGAVLRTGAAYASPANVTASGGGKYAGAVVGYATDAELDTSAGVLTLSKTVNGKAGAGGLYGYYKSTEDRVFDLENLTTTSSFTLAGGTDAGILAGMLEAEADVTVTETGVDVTDSTFTKQVRFTGGTNRGGLIGKYTNTDLTNTLDVHDVEVKVVANSGSATASGGAVGVFAGDSAVYAKIADFRLSNSGGAVNGGLVGDAGSNGSFIDVSGTVDVDGSVTSGLVDQTRAGVLRLQGTADLSGASYGSAQITRNHGNALIYALGGGADAGWTLKRGSGKVDDMGDWGEVLRLGSGSGLSESALFTVSDAAHTVTVAAPVTAMGSLTDFVRTALNIQLNDQDRGALRFASGTRSSTLLSTDLSLTADVDLSRSGIVALTRDNGDNGAYTADFDGNGHTVTLAIGEPYGQNSGGATLSAPGNVGDNNYGTVIGHRYLGLFARASGASFTDLTVDGYLSVCAGTANEYRVGGVAASVSGTSSPLTLTGVTTEQEIRLYTDTASSTWRVGGAVGCVDTAAAGTVAVSGSRFTNAITEKNVVSSHTESIGGAIGHVSSVNALTLDFDNDTVGGTFNNTVTGASQYTNVRYGGLIGGIADNSGNSHGFSRTVEINNVTVAPSASVTTRTNGSGRGALAGAFLGGEWLDTNVVIGTDGASDGVIIGTAGSGPSITASGNGTPTMAALVARATGHWTVNHVKVNRASVTASVSSSFGFLVGDGTASGCAIYLDLVSDGYDIAATTLNGTYGVFDEIVGFAVFSGKSIEENGQGVVSVRTAGGAPLVMNGSACNTYQNQTSRHTVNPNTRYYYNLDLVRAGASGAADTPGELLLWSLNRYAHSSIRSNGFFNNSFSNRLTGSCDMTGFSYYPVNASGVRIDNLSVKFRNAEIESGESGSGDTDSTARSTHSRTQQYLMHEGLFLDYTGNMTVNGLHIAGNVSNQHGGDASGFLVCGTLGGTNDTDRVTVSNLVLDGARVERSGAYAPLLINKIGKNVKLELEHVSAAAGSSGDVYSNSATAVAASSLIGDVGSDTAVNINLTFSDIRLDARTAPGANTPYGTTRSVFDRATLLNSFRFLNGSLGEYNYTYEEDWPTNRRVTYGYEVSGSVEYAGREDHYYDDSVHYTDPTGACTSACDFSSGWLRYVYTPYTDGSDLYHEIKVNVKDVNLTTGCGQYNDPYVITDGGMLATAAKIISGAPDEGVEITLPTDVGSDYDMWCASLSAHAVFVYDAANTRFFLKTAPATTVALNTVREYLAGAYYSIEAAQIDLPAGYVGLGAQDASAWTSNSGYECPYAFRGVIVGHRNEILNHSANPLIKSANGCVVRELTVSTDASVTISQASVQPFRYDQTGCASYGAVIGQVMGGDNIIDRVEVSFADAAFTVGSGLPRLMPVGGYVGVVVNGGLIFRNMDGVDASGLTGATGAPVGDAGWLYVNPVVGRVIAGCVFNERAGHYAAASAVLDNGSKNYVIPDLDPGLTMLNVTASAANNHVVTAPNAQALYVLSCIVNSGAGSATYHGSTEQNYASISATDANAVWIGWRNGCATRCADYDEVGSSAAVDGDYAVVAAQDRYAGGNKIPYLVRAYTQKQSSMYRARSLCGNSIVTSITLSGGTYHVPHGFRGIGSLYLNPSASTACRIQFKTLNGGNTTLDLAMRYQEYNHESGKENTKNSNAIENYKPYAGAGFGLFNVAYLHSFSADSDANAIKNLTLTGSVFYDIRKLTDFNYGSYPRAIQNPAGSSILYAYGWHDYQSTTGFFPDPADRVEATTVLHVGAVAGASANSLYLKNVTLSDLTVEGAKFTGGAVGYVQSKTLVIDEPSATGLTVKGGFAAGGLAGGFAGSLPTYATGSTAVGSANQNLTVKGASADSPATIGLTSIRVKGYPSVAKMTMNDFNVMFHCEGGLVGYACVGSGYTVTVQNVRVRGGSIAADRASFRPNDMRYKILAGGWFGRLDNTKIDFADSSVEGVSISANYCGGLAGVTRQTLSGTVTRVSVTGGTGDRSVSIDATNMAGGFLAYHVTSPSLNLTLDAVKVEDLTVISSHNNAEKAGAGGLVGALKTGGTKFDLINSVIRNVTVSRCSSNTGNVDNDNGLGGVFGAIGNNNTIVRGHNLLLDGVNVVKAGGDHNPGMLIGDNNNHNVKFVGVSIQGGTSATVPLVAKNGYGSSGYVVLADFDGDCTTPANTAESSLYSASSDLAAADPWVTVNPAGNVGSAGLTLTGDGVASTVAGQPVQAIWAGDKRYAYGNAYSARAYNAAKFSTYNYEQNAALTHDFAVLIVDDVSRINTTGLVNDVLNRLAGTQFNYANANKSAIYTTDVFKMVWDEGEGKFVKSGEAANLKKKSTGSDDTSQFYMDINSVDTAGRMFTLIDVKFKDPSNTSKTAYHLYLPVLVKKMLTFDFEIATGTGTNYERDWYDENARFGAPLMENLGTPASLFFRYRYQRTAEEWQAAVNGGESVLRNFPKTLLLSKSGAIPDLPGGTILTLVDTNRGGKPYYAVFSSAYHPSTGVLSLSAFRENLDGTGAAFSPVDLGEMLHLHAVQDNDNGTMVTCAAGAATVKADLNGVETFFRLATDSDPATPRYTVVVDDTDDATLGYVNLEEPYYISFFTDASASNTVYHYTISAPASFDDPANPSRIADADKLLNREGTVHMILGNIFVQSGVSLTTLPNNTEMSATTGNHVVTATMSSTVNIEPLLKSEVQGYLGSGSGISVFHSFLLNLTRTDETDSRKIITGSPVTDGTYVIRSGNGVVAATDPSDRLIAVTAGYAEIHSANLNQNINEYLVSGDGAVITATISLNYTDDANIALQFPNREDPTDTTVGTTAACTSNIAYDRGGTAFSKIAQGAADSTGHSYYCRVSNKRAKLTYNVRSDAFAGDYGPLGINPLDEDAVDEMPVSTLAVYNIKDIEEAAADYDRVRVRVRLYRRVDDYTAGLTLNTYFTSAGVRGYTPGTAGTTATEYVFTLDRAALEANSALATSLEIPLDYKVLTGAPFESAGLTYSNYKIYLSAELTKSTDATAVLDVSVADDYLIYTNARVLPEYVDP